MFRNGFSGGFLMRIGKSGLGVFWAIVIFGSAVFPGLWYAGELRAKATDIKMREDILEMVAQIAREVNPGMAAELTFTSADKNTLPFDYVRSVLARHKDKPSVRGIYTMAMRDGKLHFGPETYPEDDPMASPPGTLYEMPDKKDIEIFTKGEAFVNGPRADEYGTFVYGLAPVFRDQTDEVIMVIGADVLAGNWESKLFFERYKVYQAAAFLALIIFSFLLITRIALGRTSDFSKERSISLVKWVFLPSAAILFGLMALSFVYQVNKYRGIEREEAELFVGRAQLGWNDLLLKEAGLMRTDIAGVLSDIKLYGIQDQGMEEKIQIIGSMYAEKVKSGRDGCVRILDSEKKVVFEARGSACGQGLTPGVTAELSEKYGNDIWGVEGGPGGISRLVYVHPVEDADLFRGWVELSVETEGLARELSRAMGISGVFFAPAEEFWEDVIEDIKGENKGFFDGKTRKYPHDGKSGDIVMIEASGRDFVVAAIPLFGASGNVSGNLVLLKDISASSYQLKGRILMEVVLALIVYLGFMALLWAVLGRVEGQLRASFDSIRKRDADLLEKNRIISAVRDIDHLIVKESDRTALSSGVCRILTETMGYCLAWMALLDEEGNLSGFESSGRSERCGMLKELFQEKKYPACVQKALSGEGCFVSSPALNSPDCPVAYEPEARFCMAHPLEYEGRVYGILSGATSRDLTYGESEKALFREVAESLGFAVWKIESEEKRILADAENRELKMRIEFILGATGTGLDIIDSDLNLVYVDPGRVCIYGDYRGRKYGEYFFGEGCHGELSGMKQAIETGRTFVFEKAFPGEKGKSAQVTIIPFQDESGKWFGAGVTADITRQKAVENDLRMLFQNMMNAFVIFDPVLDGAGKFVSYRFVYINSAYEKITGIRNSDVEGKTVHEVWPGTEPEWVKRYGEVSTTGISSEFDLHHGPTGKTYHCNVYRPVSSSGRFCVVFSDITDIMKAEDERKKHEREMEVFYKASVGREERIVELKRKVASLEKELKEKAV